MLEAVQAAAVLREDGQMSALPPILCPACDLKRPPVEFAHFVPGKRFKYCVGCRGKGREKGTVKA